MEYKPALAAVERAWGKLGNHSKKSLQNRIHTLVVNKSDLSIDFIDMAPSQKNYKILEARLCSFIQILYSILISLK